VSGPLRDRIDLWVAFPRVPGAALIGGPEPEGSAAVAHRVAWTRAIQLGRAGRGLNARLAGRGLRAACRLDPAATRRVTALSEHEQMSGRGTERLLRVARTIADLDGAPAVRPDHLDEAARFRRPTLRAPFSVAS
jgi:magnesium chelatase family protein